MCVTKYSYMRTFCVLDQILHSQSMKPSTLQVQPVGDLTSLQYKNIYYRLSPQHVDNVHKAKTYNNSDM